MVQIVFDSLVRASELALLAVGLTMVYDVLRFPSFAHVEFGTIGAFVALSVATGLPLPPIWAVTLGGAVAVLAGGVLGVLADGTIFARLRHSSPIILMIASFGLGIAMRFTVRAIWGPQARGYPLPLERPWTILDGRITAESAVIIGATLVCMLGFHLLLNRTTLGIAMRATADNAELSEASGIFTERIIRLVWFMGCGFAALGGVMLGIATQLEPNMGLAIMLPVFAAAILGGIGNPYGAVLGACVIAFAENIGLGVNWAPLIHWAGIGTDYLFIPTGYKEAISFAILILALLFRPQGLLRSRSP
jgi:branched-subunit amino acid ABC-type transport system permease component